MSKTLGQIYREGCRPHQNCESFQDDEAWESHAKGIAAVARHVFAEAMAAHVAECHGPQIDPVLAAKAMEDYEAGRSIMSEELIAYLMPFADAVKKPAKPVATPQPEAGDWAMDEAKRQYNDASCWEGTPSGEARGYREAAERHYGPMVDALKEAATTAIQERDAANQRAEAAESALAELKEAMEWITCSGCSPSKGKDGRWRSMFLPDDGIEAATLADAILAAYRNTKAASVAAEGAVK